MILLGKLSAFWLIMAVTTVAVISYFIALMIDNVFGKDGFGTLGNMFVLTAGFFGGIIVAEHLGFHARGMHLATFVGLGSALGFFTLLALMRMGFERLR
jgi:hypothetical protein